MRVFWDVDTQVDFIQPDGKLYVGGAETLIDNLQVLTNYAHQAQIPIVASADAHAVGDAELSDQPDFAQTFPPHCILGTPGQSKIPETELRDPQLLEPDDLATLTAHGGDYLIHKRWFDVFTNPNTDRLIGYLDVNEAVVYGVALDVCVRDAVEGLLDRGGITITVVTDAVKALDPARGAELFKRWANRAVEFKTTEEVIRHA